MIRRVRTSISSKPSLYLPLASRLSTGVVVRPDTEIVIEGFPRSANSFAEAAFRVSQKRDVAIAHHTHAPAQVIAAAKWGIPALVIIRNPAEACRSLMMYAPGFFSESGLWREYIHFHQQIQPCRSSFVLARFETVTSGFASVVTTLNDKFGTKFEAPDDNISEQAFQLLDQLSLKRRASREDGEPYSPGRSESAKRKREQQKRHAEAAIQKMEGTRLWNRAFDIYNELSESSDV